MESYRRNSVPRNPALFSLCVVGTMRNLPEGYFSPKLTAPARETWAWDRTRPRPFLVLLPWTHACLRHLPAPASIPPSLFPSFLLRRWPWGPAECGRSTLEGLLPPCPTQRLWGWGPVTEPQWLFDPSLTERGRDATTTLRSEFPEQASSNNKCRAVTT